MFLLIAITATLALLAGAGVKVYLDRTGSPQRITRTEFVIGSALCLVVIVPTVTGVGVAVAKQSKVTFHEYWNGVETAATMTTTTCTRDGSCRHEYACDPYVEMETYFETETYTQADGTLGTRSVTKTRPVTKYHQCPYVTQENTWVVNTTLGDQVIGAGWFPANPERHQWRTGKRLPDVPAGTPAAWTAAQQRIAAGTPAGVTQQHDYDNYILASQTTILHRYSAAIDAYDKDGLLPKTSRPTGDWTAKKAHFVGPVPDGTRAGDWHTTLGRLNGAVGTELQGDVHLVLVTDDRVVDPDEYAQALLAHWQSPVMGRDALSKNGLLVVVGSTDGTTATWARAFTGMPVGNEALLEQIRADLTGATLTPGELLGAPTVTNPGSPKPTFAVGDGKLEQALWGPNRFTRVCMTCDDDGDSDPVGYTYLASQIQPSTGAKVTIVGVGFLASMAAWVAFAAYTAAGPLGRHPRPFGHTTTGPLPAWVRPPRRR